MGYLIQYKILKIIVALNVQQESERSKISMGEGGRIAVLQHTKRCLIPLKCEQLVKRWN